ncbi:MAG: FliH/SctL family protein [Candidatus Kapaibacteriales bacterium]
MQHFKIKIPKPLKDASAVLKQKERESPIIKDILPEIEYYQFDELNREIPQPFDDFTPFDYLFESEFAETKSKTFTKKNNEKNSPRYFVEFSIRNFNKPIEIDLSKINRVVATHDELQEQIQSAYNKGFEDGKQVTQLALAEEFSKFENWIKNIDSLAENLTKEFSQEIHSLGKAVVPIAIKIAEHILRNEINQKPEVILERVRHALEAVENETIFTLRINPEDLEILKSVQSQLPQLASIKLVADTKIERGGCIVESSIGSIDATFSSVLEKIAQSLNNFDFQLNISNV